MEYGLALKDFKKLFKRLGLLHRIYKDIETLRDKIRDYSFSIEEFGDVDSQLSSWSLSGVEFETNTDVDGLIYVSLDYNGVDTYTVSLFKDSGRTEKVAEGTTGSSTGTVSLSEQNDSGLSGLVNLDYSNDSTDIYLKIIPDFRLVLKWLSPEEGEEWQEAYQRFVFDLLDKLKAQMESALSKVESSFDKFLTDAWAKLVGSTESTITSQDVDTDASGDTTISYEGLAGDFADSMDDVGVSVTEAGFSVSSEFDDDNTGEGEIDATLDPLAHCRLAEATLECTDETIGSETFEVKGRLPDDTIVYPESDLVVKKHWKSPALGLNMRILRAITDTIDDVYVDVSQWSFSGETSANTDGGILHAKFTTSDSKFHFYSSAAKQSTDEVAESEEITGSGTFDIEEVNNSGLTGTVVVLSVPPSDINFQVDLHVFKEGDKIRLSFTSTLSEYNRLFGWAMSTPLPDSDSPNIPESYATRG